MSKLITSSFSQAVNIILVATANIQNSLFMFVEIICFYSLFKCIHFRLRLRNPQSGITFYNFVVPLVIGLTTFFDCCRPTRSFAGRLSQSDYCFSYLVGCFIIAGSFGKYVFLLCKIGGSMPIFRLTERYITSSFDLFCIMCWL